jgi:hypothetical protein
LVEKWEFCIVNAQHVIFCSPGGKVITGVTKGFIQSEGGVNAESFILPSIAPYFTAIAYILDDGWQPFGSDENGYLFRRKCEANVSTCCLHRGN